MHSRLPPVGIEHVDVSSILQELVALRMEVRQMSQLRTELSDLRSAVNLMTAGSNRNGNDQVTLRDERATSCQEGHATIDLPTGMAGDRRPTEVTTSVTQGH